MDKNNIKLNLLFISIIFLGVFGFFPAIHNSLVSAAGESWLSGWAYRKPITITASSTLTNYQVQVIVPYNSNIKSDYGDIRFTSSGGSTLLDYWVESKTDSSTATIWVEAPSLVPGSNTIYMYYGNSSATSTSNGSATFNFFDDFSGDLSKWTVIDGTWAIISGELRHTGTATAHYIRTSSTITDAIMEMKVKLGPTPGTTSAMGFLGRYNSLTSFYTDYYGTLVSGHQHRMGKYFPGWVELAFGALPVDSLWHKLKFSLSGSSLSSWFDGANNKSATDTSIASGYAGIRVYAPTNNYVYADDYRIRKFANPEPTISFGTEELYSSPNTNISAATTEHFAWNDTIGWIDFYITNNVNVGGAQLTGYASSSVGYIALDCATSPNGNICGASNFKISNDGSGNLSGWAYNDAIGWISFDNTTASSSYNYQVVMNLSTGDFSGYAWNDNVGWISFNCSNDNTCGTSNYKVKTGWSATSTVGVLTSSIFDTGFPNGVALNTIMWQGDQPSGTSVKFQIASNGSLSGGGIGAIDSTYRYAWNDSVGWVDFGYPAGNVNVGMSQLTGFAYNSNILEIALDCATTPAGNICSSSNFKVARNVATGDLSGYAWNDLVGWVSFNCSDPGVCGTSNYKVNVSTSTGIFSGYAWNDNVGWISFNCADPGLCGSSNYYVSTVITSATWDYKGPDGSASTYYSPINPGYPAQINLQYHNNVRYFRYKAFLYSNVGQTAGPRVDNIIINYSP